MDFDGIDNLSEEDILNLYNDTIEYGVYLSLSGSYCCAAAGMAFGGGAGCVNSFTAWCNTMNHTTYCSPCK